MAKRSSAKKVRTKANMNISLDEDVVRYARSSAKKSSKNNKTFIAVIVCLLIGLVSGFFICQYVMRNDCFELIGTDEIYLTLGESYVDEGVRAISLGRDVSDKYSISSTNMKMNDDGSFTADEVGTYYIVYTVDDWQYNMLFKVQRIRLITFVEPSEDMVEQGVVNG